MGSRFSRPTRDIPLVFVDGAGEALAKTKARVPEAVYVTANELLAVLDACAHVTSASIDI